MAIYDVSKYKAIYVYAIHDESHSGVLKIGETEFKSGLSITQLTPNCDTLKQASHKRILEQTHTAMVEYELLHAQLAVKTLVMQDGSKQYSSFSDKEVHRLLEESGYEIVPFRESGKNSEWCRVDLKTAKAGINAIANRTSLYEELGTKPVAVVQKPKIILRDEQKACVEKTKEMFKTYDEMLWDCKMRFGKTVTAYELIRQQGYQKVIVITHRPAVEAGWREDHSLILGDQNKFLAKCHESSNEFDAHMDRKNDEQLYNMIKNNQSFVYFTSVQDLRGSKIVGGKFDKNNAVYDIDWDLVIVDEAHEGTQTSLGDAVIKSLVKKNTLKLLLSGTPYNILTSFGENKYTWTYVDEQTAKQEWDKNHPGEKNPYEDLPVMNIYTFDMAEQLPASYRYVTEGVAFNFREFFRTWTGDIKSDYVNIPEGYKKGDFVHDSDVEQFLNVITDESEESKYPFSTPEFRDEFKHTFWIVPGVKEAKALSAKLKEHPVFKAYEIVNIAGDGDEEKPYDEALKLVKSCIASYDKTITISCGKLTTGVTVKEWSGVMMLSGSSSTSAAGYMQAIFRVQSPGAIDGKQKRNCYVFDFAPDRALKVVAEVHRVTNQKTGNTEQAKIELGKFINFCPVIAISGTAMRTYDVPEMMRQIKKISVENAINSGFDDNSIYRTDAGIVFDEFDSELLKKLSDVLVPQKKGKKKTSVIVNDQGLNEEQRQKAKKAQHKPKRELTEEEKELLEKYKKAKKEQQKLFDLLRSVSIRLPLLFYGADADITKIIKLEDFVNIVDDESWKEFMPENLKKDFFKEILKYYDEDVIVGAGLRIRKMAKAADEYPPTVRAAKIVEIIGKFKNPDKETVLTPWRVVNMHLNKTLGGYCFYDEKFEKEIEGEPRFVDNGDVTADIFLNQNAQILEMNSKSGLYPLYMAYTFYMLRVTGKEENLSLEEANDIWFDVLEKNVFVLCKTEMAKSITKRTLTGYYDKPVNAVYLTKLLERMKDSDRLSKKLKNPNTWGKDGERMNFDAIVGNPPYQETVRFATNGNNNNTIDVYPRFKEVAIKTAPVVSLIYPAKDLQRGKTNTLDKNLIKVRIYNGSNKEAEKNIPGEPSVFGDAVRRIPGDVGVFLWNANRPTEKINYQEVDIIRTEKILPVRKEFFELAKHLEPYANSAGDYNIRKCCESDFVEKNKSSVLSKEVKRNEPAPDGYTKVLTNDKGGSGGKANWFYIKTDKLDYIQPTLYKVVISSAFPNEAFKNPDNIEILKDDEMFGRTKKCIYFADNLSDAENYIKYMRTNFVKNIVEMTPYSFLYYLPDFNEIKNKIDWSQNIDNIDSQLLDMLNL